MPLHKNAISKKLNGKLALLRIWNLELVSGH